MTITSEHLQKAAKAAGIRCIEYTNDYDGRYGLMMCDSIGRHTKTWSPHIDRGQLLDLAMACNLVIDFLIGEVFWLKGNDTYGAYSFTPKDFPALAEAVILAACEQFDAKGGE